VYHNLTSKCRDPRVFAINPRDSLIQDNLWGCVEVQGLNQVSQLLGHCRSWKKMKFCSKIKTLCLYFTSTKAVNLSSVNMRNCQMKYSYPCMLKYNKNMWPENLALFIYLGNSLCWNSQIAWLQSTRVVVSVAMG